MSSRKLSTDQRLVLNTLYRAYLANRSLALSQLMPALPSLSRARLYAAVTQLQADGRICARWDSTARPPRRLFGLSPHGLAALAAFESVNPSVSGAQA